VKSSNENKTHPVLLFDLDGTLVDSVYLHVIAWREAFEELGIRISNWRIHRRIGMSDILIAKILSRKTGQPLDADQTEKLRHLHTRFYLQRSKELRVLPGAGEILSLLSKSSIRYAIVTSSSMERASGSLKLLGVGEDISVITIERASFGKPDPDLFLVAMEALQVASRECIIIGDSVWDILAARRAGALGVGLLTGGYGKEALYRAGAYRVYDDPADLIDNLDEIGVHL
jgi:HAD superfamily hydrolase (TIGR01509 family)